VSVKLYRYVYIQKQLRLTQKNVQHYLNCNCKQKQA